MPTLAEAYNRFLQVDRSPYTTQNYQRILSRLVQAIGPVRDISRISSEDLEDWFYPTINGKKPLKRSTAVSYLGVVQRFFNDCRNRGYISTSPADALRVRHNEEAPRRNRAIPPAELRRMMAVASFNKRNYAVMLFFMVTGCRTGGITSLTRSNLYLDQYRAHVKEKGGRWEWVHFGEATAAALRAWLAVRPHCEHDAVFTTTSGNGARPLTKHGFRSIVEELSKKAGVSRIYTPHCLRHSRGHSLAWKGVPESLTGEVLNHLGKDSTRIYYPNDEQMVSAIVRAYELAALEDVETVEKIIPLFKGKEGVS
jgi:integrase/recombinase XerC